MRLLYTGLDNLLKGVQKMVPKLTEYPIISDLNTTMIYLGPVTDLAQVEIKKDKVNKGWLYNVNSIVFFHYEDALYEVFIGPLRDLALDKFSAKKMIPADAPPKAGCMVRRADASIIGYLEVKDLLHISTRIGHQIEL